MKRRMATVGLMVALGCATGPSGSHVPELGRYAFHTSWPIAGFTDPATVDGTLTLTATGETITYQIVLAESVPLTKSGTASYSEANGYVIVTPNVGRAGIWSLLPHLWRDGSGYRCTGNAVSGNTFTGTPMTCSWTFLGR